MVLESNPGRGAMGLVALLYSIGVHSKKKTNLTTYSENYCNFFLFCTSITMLAY